MHSVVQSVSDIGCKTVCWEACVHHRSGKGANRSHWLLIPLSDKRCMCLVPAEHWRQPRSLSVQQRQLLPRLHLQLYIRSTFVTVRGPKHARPTLLGAHSPAVSGLSCHVIIFSYCEVIILLPGCSAATFVYISHLVASYCSPVSPHVECAACFYCRAQFDPTLRIALSLSIAVV